jgi:hypothetical protein
MDVTVRKAEPTTEKDRSFFLVAHVEEFADHAEAYVVLGGVQYLIEIRYS